MPYVVETSFGLLGEGECPAAYSRTEFLAAVYANSQDTSIELPDIFSSRVSYLMPAAIVGLAIRKRLQFSLHDVFLSPTMQSFLSVCRRLCLSISRKATGDTATSKTFTNLSGYYTYMSMIKSLQANFIGSLGHF